MNPYPGLQPFDGKKDARYYFGRELFLASFVTRVRISPLTIFFGRSGLGKTSFLLCRFIQELSKNSAVEYVNTWSSDEAWKIIEERSSRLLVAEASHPEAKTDATSWTPESDNERQHEKPVLILDQFEDVFKGSGDRRKLWETLAKVVNLANSPIRVVVSMREEWLGAWADSTEFIPDSLRNGIRLPPLTELELTRAVNEPAALEGTVTVDPAFATQLIRSLRTPDVFDLNETYVPPGLVQLVCHWLWCKVASSPARAIDWRLYETVGGLKQIRRELVWQGLKQSGGREGLTTTECILWIGASQHLTVAGDAKFLTTASEIARRLTVDDLGFGAQIVLGTLPLHDRQYLRMLRENRPAPSLSLESKIGSVLDKAVVAKFLKTPEPTKDKRRLYELVHDALGPMFRQFAFEFDQRLKLRFIKIAGSIVLFLSVAASLAITFSLLPDIHEAFPAVPRSLYNGIHNSAIFERFATGIVGFIELALIGCLLCGAYWLISPIISPMILRAFSWRLRPAIAAGPRPLRQTIVGFGAAYSLLVVALLGIAANSSHIEAWVTRLVNEPAKWRFDQRGNMNGFAEDVSGAGYRCMLFGRHAVRRVGRDLATSFTPDTYCAPQAFRGDDLKSFTLTAWVRPQLGTEGDLVTLAAPDGTSREALAPAFQLTFRRDRIVASVKGLQGTAPVTLAVPVPSPSPENPLFVALVRYSDPGTIRLYVNELPFAEHDEKAAPLSGGRIVFGDAPGDKIRAGQPNEKGFTGELMTASFYFRELSSRELADIARCPPGGCGNKVPAPTRWEKKHATPQPTKRPNAS